MEPAVLLREDGPLNADCLSIDKLDVRPAPAVSERSR